MLVMEELIELSGFQVRGWLQLQRACASDLLKFILPTLHLGALCGGLLNPESWRSGA
jgi:hypothetical protein